MMHIANAPKRRSKPMNWRGVQYQSQAEAFAAMFLTHLGIPFMYEAEAYLPDDSPEPTRPDFWLPDHSAWLEIKGHDDFDDRQVRRLSAAHDETVFVATAPLWYSHWNAKRGDSILVYRGGELVDRKYEFCRCARCNAWTIQYLGFQSRHKCGAPPLAYGAGDKIERETADIIRAAGAEIEAFKAWRAIDR